MVPLMVANLFTLFAATVMKSSTVWIDASVTVNVALDQVRQSGSDKWLVTDPSGVIGVVNRTRLSRELADHADDPLAQILDALDFPHVHPDQGLDLALERMGANQIDLIPVVNRANIHQLAGTIALQDVLDVYGVAPRQSPA